MTRLTTSLAALVAVVALSGVVQQSQADILDQSFDPGPSVTLIAGFTSSIDHSQTFTAGLTGTLSRIEVDIEHIIPVVGNVLFDVRSTSGGVPLENNASVLASLTVPATSIPNPRGFFSFDISSQLVAVNPGDVLAIVLRSTAPGAISWYGHSTNQYAPGEGFFRNAGAGVPTWTPTTSFPSTGNDLGFKTYIIPEPSTFALLALATLGLIACRWGRRMVVPAVLGACLACGGGQALQAAYIDEVLADSPIAFELRQLLFKTKHGRTYRAVYRIDKDQVIVFRICGPGQAPLSPDEVPLG